MLLISLSVTYVVYVLLSVVVEVEDSDTTADDMGPPGETGAGDEVASATGHTVVYRLITSVVTEPSFAGQLVTVGAQDVIV